ncbi:MAG TPA: hypothetical protein VI793_17250 [Anaerolineales bacterium]|nr:hypothetical protein [Anaerolineales bacterium]
MEHNHPATDRPVRIPPVIWILGFGLVVALAAIFVFNVPLSTVGYYALIALFLGGHFFMHGAHGGHGGHAGHGQRTGSTTNMDSPAKAAQYDKDEHTGHSGGCH